MALEAQSHRGSLVFSASKNASPGVSTPDQLRMTQEANLRLLRLCGRSGVRCGKAFQRLTHRKSACYGNQSDVLVHIFRQASHCSLIEVDFVFR